MKNQDELLNKLFSSAKSEPVVFTTDDLAELIQSRTEPPSERKQSFTNRSKIMTATAAIIGIGLYYWLSYESAPTATMPLETLALQETNNTGNSYTEKAPSLEDKTAEAFIVSQSGIQPLGSQILFKTPQHLATSSATKIDGVEIVKLTPDEIRELNLEVDTKRCSMSEYIKYDTTKGTSRLTFTDGVRSEIAFDHVPGKVPSWLNLSTELAPVAITDERGEVRMSIRKTDDKKRQKVSRLNLKKGKTLITYPVYPDDTTWTAAKMRVTKMEHRKIGIDVAFDTISREQWEAEKKQAAFESAMMNQKISSGNLVGVTPATGTQCSFNLIFWFEPSPVFLAALPDRYRVPIMNALEGDTRTITTDSLYAKRVIQSSGEIDLTTLEEQQRQSITDEGVREPIPGCRYIETCRLMSGAIVSSDVFPVPAVDHINIKCIMSSDRSCTISLHHINGIIAKELARGVLLARGETVIGASLGGIESGIYLMSLLTDQGERIVHRIVIRK